MIYSCFAGMGKTTLEKNYPDKYLDLESSDFQWVWDEDVPEDVEERKGNNNKTKNPSFPYNYINTMVAANDLGFHVLISSQPEVLQGLAQRNIPFITVTPGPELKEHYVSRYKDRGNPEPFVNLMENNFENFSQDMATNTDAEMNIVVRNPRAFLEDVLEQK